MLARRAYRFLIGTEPDDQTSFSLGSKNRRAAVRFCSPAQQFLPDRPPTILRNMNLDTPPHDHEDPQHTSEERAFAASRSTRVSGGVNLALSITQVVVGVVAKSQSLVADVIPRCPQPATRNGPS
jgi:hypothetical protein